MYPKHTQPQMDPSKLVRLIWSEFERWQVSQRAIMERRREEISKEQDSKWRATPARSRSRKEEHEANKALLQKKVQEEYFSNAREEWQRRLQNSHLEDDDWGPMTVLETRAVERALGGDLDDEGAPTENVPIITQPQPQQLPKAAAPPAPAPLPKSAPALSSRSTNISASSYTFVSPEDFGTDDELFEAVSSYIVPTDESDDDHAPITIPIHDSKGWGLDSVHFPQSNGSSPDHSMSSSSYDYFSLPRTHAKATDPNPAPPKRPPDIDRQRRIQGPSYIGPRLSDSDDTSEEEADFEKFKMETRITKIIEFHRAAAQADIDLAITIQNERKSKKSGKASDALKVAEHEKQMLELQAKKEEERKAIVATERRKRRDEIRKRSTLREPARAANTATHQSWDSLFESQSLRIDIDMNGALFLRKEGPSANETENQIWDIQTALPSTYQLPTEVLRGRKQSLGRDTPIVPVKQSGWKTSTPAQPTKSQWSMTNSATPVPERKAEQIPRFSDSAHPLAQSVSFDDQDFQVPGSFPGEATALPVPSGWGKKTGTEIGQTKKPTVLVESSKKATSALAAGSSKNQLSMASSPPDPPSAKKASPPIVESKPIPMPSATPPSKKLNKKQRQIGKKPGGSTATDVEASTEVEPDMSSTPRPSLISMMKPFKADDVTLTPRPSGTRRLDPPEPSTSALENETPWERRLRLGTEGSGSRPNPPKAAQPILEDETPWSRMKSREKQPNPDAQIASASKPWPFGDEDEDSPWTNMSQKSHQYRFPGPSHLSKSIPLATQDEEISRAQMIANQKSNNVFSTETKPVAEDEETPWNRVMKQKLQTPLPTTVTTEEEEKSLWSRMYGTKSSIMTHDQATHPPIMRNVQQTNNSNVWMPAAKQPSIASDPNRTSYKPTSFTSRSGQFWTPGGSGFELELPDADNGYGLAPASILKGSQAKKAKDKRVTIEEVSDDEGHDGRKPSHHRLPSNSRSILDIVEPKPSVPSNMFTNIFEYEGDDDETESSSFAPTPSTAPTSPPSEIHMDDEWLSGIAEGVKNGDWERLLKEGISDPPAKSMPSPWITDPKKKEPATPHTLDGAKLMSALESFDDKPPQAPSPPKPAVPAPAAPEKKEPAPKPIKEVKGKGKGKGKGGRTK